uniref:Uncharacterized protein n=1 Tax=Arundo donax TaxID=35708 RepID=A0A0A9GQE3_ARUDO
MDGLGMTCKLQHVVDCWFTKNSCFA